MPVMTKQLVIVCIGMVICRWAESHRKWPDGKPWYEDAYGALWVGACIPEEQQAKMKAWKEQVSLHTRPGFSPTALALQLLAQYHVSCCALITLC